MSDDCGGGGDTSCGGGDTSCGGGDSSCGGGDNTNSGGGNDSHCGGGSNDSHGGGSHTPNLGGNHNDLPTYNDSSITHPHSIFSHGQTYPYEHAVSGLGDPMSNNCYGTYTSRRKAYLKTKNNERVSNGSTSCMCLKICAAASIAAALGVIVFVFIGIQNAS